MKVSLLKHFSIKKKIQLILGSIFFKIYTFFPEKVFIEINLLTKILKKGYNAEHSAKKLILSKDGISIELRRDGSDLMVFQQIFLNAEFKNLIDILEEKKIVIKTIIDAGANIGLVSIYLKHHYPKAQVIAIEPDSDNYKQLQMNFALNKIEPATIFNEGVWFENTFLSISEDFRDGLEWSRQLVKHADGKPMITVNTIASYMKRLNWQSVDLLKVDVEGAEETIFSNESDLSFLNRIKVITIEIHDIFRHGHRIMSLLQNYGFEIYFSGELMIGIKRAKH